MKRCKVVGILLISALTLSSCSDLNRDTTHTSKVDPKIDSAITDNSKAIQIVENDTTTYPKAKLEEPVIKLTKDTIVESITDLSNYEYSDIEYLHDNGEALTGSKVIVVGTYDGDNSYIKASGDDKGVVYIDLVRGEEIQQQLGNVLTEGQEVAVVGVVSHEKTDLYSATTLNLAHIVGLDEQADSLKTRTSEKLKETVKNKAKNPTPTTTVITFGENILTDSPDLPSNADTSVEVEPGAAVPAFEPVVIEPTKEEDDKEGYWVRVTDAITIGGEPLYECPNCHFQHISGVEVSVRYSRCPECNMKLKYPSDSIISKKYWERDKDAITIGGDPCYKCPVCGFSHVYGVESPTRYNSCPECGTDLEYP